MPIRFSFHALFHLMACFLLALLTACGGGSGKGGSGIPVPVVPPSALVYATNPGVYTLGQAIPLNLPSHGGGPATAYTVTPGLPAGLSLNGTSGAVSGTPTAIVATAPYTVTATNSGGSATAVLSIAVNDLPPTNFHYVTPSPTYTVGTAITPNLVVHDGGAVTSYSVSPALPAGLVFNAVSGAIAGTPSVSAPTTTYTATASNSGGSTTATLSLSVNDPPPIAPSFTTQPAPQSVTAPAAATFAVAVSGLPTPMMQWQRSNDSGASWVDLVGATFSTYTTAATSGTDNGARFRVTASNSAGTLTSAEATLTVVSLGKVWQAAALMGPAISGSVMDPHIAFDAQGNAMAIWMHNDAGVNRYDLWANRYVAGTGWGTPQVIFTGVDFRVNRPQLGVAADGKALVVWELMDDPYNPKPHIWSISYAPGTGWGTAAGIDNDSGSLISGSPKLAVAANGTALAVWGQGDSLTVINVCMARGSTNTGWVGSPTVLVTGPLAQAGQVSTPDVILNAQGVGFAFWQYYNGTNFSLQAAPIAAGVAGVSQAVATAGSFYNPHAAVNAAGAVVVVWGQYNGSRLEIASNRFEPTLGWGSPTQVNSSGWTPFNQTPDPQIHLDDAGIATALWVEGTGASSPKVWNHQSAAGWGMPEIITYSLGEYRLAGNGAGQILGARFSGSNLYAAPTYLVTTADWGAGTPLSSTGIIPLGLTMDANGNGLATWLQPESGGGYALWGSVYR